MLLLVLYSRCSDQVGMIYQFVAASRQSARRVEALGCKMLLSLPRIAA